MHFINCCLHFHVAYKLPVPAPFMLHYTVVFSVAYVIDHCEVHKSSDTFSMVTDEHLAILKIWPGLSVMGNWLNR
jgi:hypothetical protein